MDIHVFVNSLMQVLNELDDGIAREIISMIPLQSYNSYSPQLYQSRRCDGENLCIYINVFELSKYPLWKANLIFELLRILHLPMRYFSKLLKK